eukprot:NODE_251_length_1101_cov_179.840304_g211_i0.p1 GENE.NODE_251_length_1101_cov_179.840304_g211_i0~~NODE_251_length_1101_cov_179.840304_g211_i0.p1  ORF type:complete len:274 (-),score=26.93 NODE_251_length_1101_cov_179.840304_g211_i0:279-1013(-)
MTEALLVYTGEVVPSLRTLCKRFDFWRYLACESAGERINFWSLTSYLPYFGWDPTGIDTAVNASAATVPFTFCHMTIQHWTLMAYGGYRGTLRYKLMSESTDDQDTTNWLDVNRDADSSTTGYFYSWEARLDMAASIAARARQILGYCNQTGDGTAVTPKQANPTLEFDMPWYDHRRFLMCKTTAQAATTQFEGYHKFNIHMASDTRSAHSAGIYTYWATGEDFQCAFYLGPPILYSVATLPTP